MEGDTPSFLNLINNGLSDHDHPDWGGWGGRYVNVRDNEWLDPVLEPGYQYPEVRAVGVTQCTLNSGPAIRWVR